MIRKVLTVVLVGGLVAACSNGSDRQRAQDELPGAPEPPSAGAIEALAPDESTGEVATAASTSQHDPSATGGATDVASAEGSGQGSPAPNAALTEPDSDGAASEADAPPVDIFEVMQSGGWELSSEADLADYLPIPPRSDGQIARFSLGPQSVSIARVTYRAAVFADPHEGWIRERMALLPEAHERVVRRGATVVHIRADSEAAAQAALLLFETALAATTDEEDG